MVAVVVVVVVLVVLVGSFRYIFRRNALAKSKKWVQPRGGKRVCGAIVAQDAYNDASSSGHDDHDEDDDDGTIW